MHKKIKHFTDRNSGFSLIEILVGLVIGLLATLVIMQIFSVFEGQKRSTTGNADAQTNGSIALFNMQRDLQIAGFGLPVFDSTNSPFNCDPEPTIDHDGSGGTPAIGISPVIITDGGNAAGASDSIAIRYGSTNAGAVAVITNDVINAANIATGIAVPTNLGCQTAVNADATDTVLISDKSNPTVCGMSKVSNAASNPFPDATHIKLQSAPAGFTTGTQKNIACMGVWNEYRYTVTTNQLTRTGAVNANGVPVATAIPIMSDIVNIQAQYGISATATDNQISQWVDASGAWAAPTIADRNRIKAVRIAVVARNGTLERANVDGSVTCSSLTSAAPTGLCAWAGTGASPAPVINLSNDANWQRYRYRVYETIVPLRNVVWSRGSLS